MVTETLKRKVVKKTRRPRSNSETQYMTVRKEFQRKMET